MVREWPGLARVMDNIGMIARNSERGFAKDD